MTEVTVLWGKEKLTVTCDSSKPVRDFMMELFRLTHVPLDRQKLTMPRQQIDPDGSWKPGQVKSGSRFMLLGTADPPPAPPPENPVDDPVEPDAEEVVPEGSLSSSEASLIMTGLPNFGTTCWLNSVIQTLRLLPRVVSTLQSTPRYELHPFAGPLARLLVNFHPERVNFKGLADAIINSKPEFREVDETTHSQKQQDAAEAFDYIVNELRRAGASITELFEIGVKIERNRIGTDDRQSGRELLYRLPVSINENVREIPQGFDLESTVNRGTDEEPILWEQKRTIEKLPVYLTCQLLRFFYKKNENVAAKVLRPVIHPKRIDMIRFLTDELRATLATKRESGDESAGKYLLKAIITHRGRTLNGGHYLTFVRVKDLWFRFDDQKVTEVEDVEIDKLYGSADWHTSSLVIYEAE